ncbi:MAG TPA: fused MFS/spermidine synthase [Nannocystis sp.]
MRAISTTPSPLPSLVARVVPRPGARASTCAFSLILSLGTAACTPPEPDAPAPAEQVEAPVLDDTPLPAPAPPQRVRGKQVLAEVTSPYSQIRVHQQGTRRSLAFVRARGDEAVQTTLDLADPDAPVHKYVQALTAPLLVVDDPRRLLLVGLGGGALVRYMHARLPAARFDAVELDPEVVRLAAAWFGIVPGPRLGVFTGDGVRFIADGSDTYDVIWLDAFLDPGAPGTDNAGVPEELRGTGFLERVRARLNPGGVAAFNVHFLTGYREHVDAIASVFPRVYVTRAPGANEIVVLALAAGRELDAEALAARAAALDGSGRWKHKFAELAAAMYPWTRAPAP